MPLTLQEWQTLNRQADLQETEIFQHDPTGITKIIVRKTQRQLDAYLQWACFKRDGYRCQYCFREGIPLTVDHIILWEENGAPILDNLMTACRSCNKDRGRMQYEDWIVSDVYKRKSINLPKEIKEKNQKIVEKLSYLRTFNVQHVRSR